MNIYHIVVDKLEIGSMPKAEDQQKVHLDMNVHGSAAGSADVQWFF